MPGPGYAFLSEEEKQNVNLVLNSWTLTRYAYGVPEFTSFVRQTELRAQELLGVAHAIAVNSGTSALVTGLAALGIGPGDEVIVPGYTFIASIGAIVFAGATPVLAEVDETLTLDPVDVESKITKRTKAVMPVHMLGAPCDMKRLVEIAERHSLLIIEDVAQACGGSFKGKRLGSIGHVGAFSLNPFKVITSGEGGVFTTSNTHLYQRAYAFQDQGWFPLRTDTGEGDILFGLNLRMAELAGAVASAQFAKLNSVLDATRSAKSMFLDRLTLPSDGSVAVRPSNDEAGDCATVLVFTFRDAERAKQIAATLGTHTLEDSGRHYYQNMTQLRNLYDKRAPSSVFHRFTDDSVMTRPFPSLPKTDSLLRRSLGVSIGVSDKYLGAGFGVTVLDSIEQIRARADQLSEALAESPVFLIA